MTGRSLLDAQLPVASGIRLLGLTLSGIGALPATPEQPILPLG